MRRNRMFAALIGLAALGLLSQDAFARARMYHPGLGRFMQRDPLGTPTEPMVTCGTSDSRFTRHEPTAQYTDGMSLYQYARSQPISLRDWRGLDAGFVRESLGLYSHTATLVQVRDDSGVVIGVLRVDFADANYSRSGRTSTILRGPGNVRLTLLDSHALDSIDRSDWIPGSVNDDRRLLDWILDTAGKNRKWFCAKLAENRNRLLTGVDCDGNGPWADYSIAVNNCNNYTGHAINEYVGGGFVAEAITEGLDGGILQLMWQQRSWALIRDRYEERLKEVLEWRELDRPGRWVPTSIEETRGWLHNYDTIYQLVPYKGRLVFKQMVPKPRVHTFVRYGEGVL